ncbi:hypothetical protein GCM10028794_17750 [Silanimonas algicola]
MRTEADAQQRTPLLEPPADQRPLVGKEGIARIVFGADRSAEDDEQVRGIDRRGVERVDADVEGLDLPASGGEPRGQQAEVLEGDMAERERSRHAGLVGAVSGPW